MGIKLIANNKKAFHEFFISEVLEAGLALLGPEVKSLRDGKANLRDSYCRIQGGELFVHQMHKRQGWDCPRVYKSSNHNS